VDWIETSLLADDPTFAAKVGLEAAGTATGALNRAARTCQPDKWVIAAAKRLAYCTPPAGSKGSVTSGVLQSDLFTDD